MIKLDLGTMVSISSWVVAIGVTLLRAFVAALCIDSYMVDRINKKNMSRKDFMVLFVAILMIL